MRVREKGKISFPVKRSFPLLLNISPYREQSDYKTIYIPEIGKQIMKR